MRRPGPFVAVDTGLGRNPKIERIGAVAFRLYIVALCHCGDELTDGHVSTAAMRRLQVEARAGSRAIGELRAAGLLEGHGPWKIPDYLEWNRSREQVKDARAAGAERVRAHRERRRLERPNTPQRNGPSNPLRNGPIEVEVEQEKVLGSTPTPHHDPGSSEQPATLQPVTTQDTTSLAKSAAELLERLRAGQAE